MSAVTLDVIEAKQTELSKLIAQFKEDVRKPVLHRLPAIKISLRPGERYAGAVISEFGNVMHHVVLMAERPTGKLNWQAAKDWPASVGGELPTRQEQALLYANCKPHLQTVWYWSCEENEDDTSFARGCHFHDGSQGSLLKSYEGSVVAVRRIGGGV